MIIEERKITVGEVCEGYFNDAEEGVVGEAVHRFHIIYVLYGNVLASPNI